MKVLLFSAEWPEYMIPLANAMSKHCKAVLMMPNNYGLTNDHLRCLDPDVTLVTFELIDYKSIRKNSVMLWRILNVLWKEQPDILHIQSNGLRLFHWVAFLKPPRTKIVNTIHDPEKHSGDLPSLATNDSTVIYLMRFFTKQYIVHGHRLIDDLARSYGVSREKISSVPHGHFGIYKQFQKTHAREMGFNVLFFGRIWPYKGLEYFIDAANIVHEHHPEVQFCVAGKGESIEKYTDRIRNRQLFKIINKRIPNEEVGLLFEQASVVVLPYTEATQSGVIPLAFAYGKPVIATRVGGLPDVVNDGTTGFLVDPKSAVQIAEKIIVLLNDPSVRSQMGKQADEFAQQELSWDKIASSTISVYLRS